MFYIIKTVLFNDYILDKHCSESLVGRNFVPFQGKKEKGGGKEKVLVSLKAAGTSHAILKDLLYSVVLLSSEKENL